MLFTDSLINSAPDDWKLVFKIDANGGNTNVYDIYMDRGITYNINDKKALNLTRRTGKHFKSDIINHWSDVDIEEVKVVVYQYGEEKAFLTFNGTGTDMTNWFSQKRMQNSSYSDLKHASQGEGYFFSIAGVSHPSRRFYVNKDWTLTQWCYDTGWLLVTAGSDGYCPFELGNTFSILYSPESTSITNRDIKVSTCQPLRHSAEACSTPVQLAYNTYCYKLCDKSLTQTDLEEKMQKLEKELSVSRKDTNSKLCMVYCCLKHSCECTF
ncbi:unnamed protein product [Mytilus edulis]|uniref:Uncharacterized protein n=1 Tax=Mytilus edulis TaxID=6550 RepID=A0A8S3S7B4_MYTED|nr:unnamed protein product [Mytilus edulis]